ncbi:DUF6428 family protein [Niabella sp. W65]|nr:DUF6428 family protein [Niabella sp. W65]MCH7366110.1 DUF6428 family protein [Niabella sp. W65]ULT41837.1 DUF6428 family protein [Niabella sp. I65]
MKLSELKELLPGLNKTAFQLPGGSWVPEHFHVTEAGLVTRHFIDCGGTIRSEQVVHFQLWHSNDYGHRLQPQQLLHIIRLSEEKLGIPNLEIEVEYQADTIGRYRLAFNGSHFVLETTTTGCLAEKACSVPAPFSQVNSVTLSTSSCCGGGKC